MFHNQIQCSTAYFQHKVQVAQEMHYTLNQAAVFETELYSVKLLGFL